MKTIEDKARAYDEAIKKAAALYKASEPMSGCNVIIETLFPELAESEDEKVRKALIDFFGKSAKYGGQTNGVYDKDILAWLERQVEQNFEMKTAEESLGVDSKTHNKIVVECIFGEQKSADNVGPKFHEGEWITNGDYTWKIVEVKPLDYILQSQDGNVVDDTISHVDEQFHSFTIEDAKDGDVLAYGDNPNDCHVEVTMIFKSVRNEKSAFTHFHFFDDKFRVNDWCDCGKNAHPATKEQRELLFKKMKEAGYEWDDRNKVMTKIEQKSIDSYCQENCKGFQETGKCFVDGDCKAKKEAEQKPAWSEEDEELLKWSINNLTELKDRFGEEYGKVGKCIDWVKSLKNRVQPKPKQEWSEEDEKIMNGLIDSLTRISLNTRTDSTSPNYTFYKEIDWLKSLRPQNHWKPSDEQIASITCAVRKMKESACYDSELVSLFNDLKKLKG